jgi:thiosulfate sulfurtransferase
MPFKRISIDEAKAIIDTGGATIGDVRDADSYRSSCIAGAIHLQQETLDDFLQATPKDKPLILYCYHGNSSQGAADYFHGLGFEEVYSVDGGFEAWRAKY